MGRKTREKASKDAKIAELLADIDGYIQTARPPILNEFAHTHGMTGAELRELAQGTAALARALQRLREAKEIDLERGALSGAYKTTAAIFSLKQLGWTGKDEEDGGELEAAGVILLGEVAEEG